VEKAYADSYMRGTKYVICILLIHLHHYAHHAMLSSIRMCIVHLKLYQQALSCYKTLTYFNTPPSDDTYYKISLNGTQTA